MWWTLFDLLKHLFYLEIAEYRLIINEERRIRKKIKKLIKMLLLSQILACIMPYFVMVEFTGASKTQGTKPNFIIMLMDDVSQVFTCAVLFLKWS